MNLQEPGAKKRHLAVILATCHGERRLRDQAVLALSSGPTSFLVSASRLYHFSEPPLPHPQNGH